MNNDPLAELRKLGQSLWLDSLRRAMFSSGELQRYLDVDGIAGVTTNPWLFEKVVSGSHDYDEDLRRLASQHASAEDIYRLVMIQDAQQACDLFRPRYDRTQGREGWVSIDTPPRPVHDTAALLAESRRLWSAVNRPNVMIRMPATFEALPAIRELIREGTNVNVTRCFAVSRYREVADAYLAGLEARLADGRPLTGIASVVGFLVNRIDVLVDSLLEKIILRRETGAETAKSIRGKVGIATAKVAYRAYQEICRGVRFRRLAALGAVPQRLVWAGTSSRTPGYSDVLYVDSLAGPDTITSVSPEVLLAYRDHGQPAARLSENLDQSDQVLRSLLQLGIDLDEVMQQLRDEGIDRFFEPFDRLVIAAGEGRVRAADKALGRQTLSLGDDESAVRRRIGALEKLRFATQLWRKQPGLWGDTVRDPEAIRGNLGWLRVAERMEAHVPRLVDFAAEVASDGFQRGIWIGSKAVSLIPSIFKDFPPPGGDGMPLTVLDPGNPASILAIEQEIPLPRTLFVVASKSGTEASLLATLERLYSLLRKEAGAKAGGQLVTVSDVGTPLAEWSLENGFRRVYRNFSDVGERYSAMSTFGIVAAALMGLDLGELLARALRMQHACASCVPLAENPGMTLGIALGELALQGRNRVILLLPPPLQAFGKWLEDLLALGDAAILPVLGEVPVRPAEHGENSLFVCLHLKGQAEPALTDSLSDLRRAGRPVITIEIDDPLDLGQECFRWQMAAATAAALLGVNPFADACVPAP